MNTRQFTHPAFPDLVKTVPATAAKGWERAGWVPVEEQPSKRPAKKPTRTRAAKK